MHRERNRVASGRSPGPPPTADACAEAGSQPFRIYTANRSLGPGAAIYPPIAYLPQGLALGIARALHLPVDSAYDPHQAGDLNNKRRRSICSFPADHAKPPELALLTLPMSLFQLASAALDGFSTSMTVLAPVFIKPYRKPFLASSPSSPQLVTS